MRVYKSSERSMYIDGKEVYFNKKISSFVIYNGKVIVVFSVKLDPRKWENQEEARNVEAYNSRGDRIWKIGMLVFSKEFPSCDYGGVFEKEGVLMAYNTYGHTVSVDENNGAVEFYPKNQGRPW